MPILPRAGERAGHTPQIAVIQLVDRWRFEAGDLAALRVDPAHDVLDRAVLAGGIQRLEDDEQGARILGVQLLLVVGQELHAFVQEGRGVFRLLIAGGVAGIEVLLEVDLAAGRDRKALDEFLDVSGVDFHGREILLVRLGENRWKGRGGRGPVRANVVALF